MTGAINDTKSMAFDESEPYLRNPIPGVKRTVRDLRPTHYLFKLVSYSSLKDEKYESTVFKADGYNWKLFLYPNGDTKRGGNGHVSLFLAITGTETLPREWEVNVNFKLFIFDQIKDKYLTIQDEGEGAIRRFHSMKTEWGFSQLVPLDVFNNASNGYLIDNSCVFGAEVFVLKSASFKSYSLLLTATNDTYIDTYIWKIEKFSTLRDECYYSNVFTLVGMKWRLLFYPKGNGTPKSKAMSLYLSLVDVPRKYRVEVNLNLSIKDQLNNNYYYERRVSAPSKKGPFVWGFREFATIVEHNDIPGGGGFRSCCVRNDTIIFKAQITKLSLLKDVEISGVKT